MVASVISNNHVRERPHYTLGVRRMSLSRWDQDEGSDSDHVTGLKWDKGLVDHYEIPAVQWAKLPRYWREGAVEVRPFTAETRPRVSMAQGLSGEAMKGESDDDGNPRSR
jgi:hypothetical protein